MITCISALEREDWNVIFEVPGKTMLAAMPALQLLVERLCWHKPGLNTRGLLCNLQQHSEEELTH